MDGGEYLTVGYIYASAFPLIHLDYVLFVIQMMARHCHVISFGIFLPIFQKYYDPLPSLKIGTLRIYRVLTFC